MRSALGVLLNAAAFSVVAWLLPGPLLVGGRSALLAGLTILIAATAGILAARALGRPGDGDGQPSGPRRLRWTVVVVRLAGLEAVLLLIIALAGPALGLAARVGDLPRAITLSSVAILVGAALTLACGAIVSDRVAATFVRRAATVRSGADRLQTTILAIFLMSGAAGLVYEVVWARQLVLVFGNTTQAVSAILTGYFGGLAIGAVVGGRLADRSRRPLRLYGAIELTLVVVVLLTPVLFRGIHELYRPIFSSLETQPTLLALVRYGLALLALAPATVLMGATLPTLSRHLSRDASALTGMFGRLYAANTFGAIVGTVVAGLVLIEVLGLTLTLVVGATASAVAGVAAIVLDRRQEAIARRPVAAQAGAADAGPPGGGGAGAAPSDRRAGSTHRLSLLIAFISGLTSLGYQVLWTRMLASGSGNTTYVFTLILATFLVGIALGAAFVARRPRAVEADTPVLGSLQLLVAAIALAGLVVLSGNVPGLPFIVRVVIVVLPATLTLGVMLPLASGLLASSDGRVGRDTGALLGANTLGTILGTFAVPFILIPAIGSPRSLVVLALINIALGLILLARGARAGVTIRRPRPALGAALGLVAIVGLLVPNPLVRDPGATRLLRESVLLRDAEDEIASVQAGGPSTGRRLLVGGTGMTILTVDAKLMAYLPLIIRPASERMLVIAFGMGSAFRSGVIAGLDVDGVELVPSVIDMFRFFYPDASSVLANPRARVVITDGRNYVELTDQTYDLVVVDPPPPIESSGTSVLYSREFYAASASRLRPGGVMMEWMPYEQTVNEFRAHVRTFADVFPNVVIAFGPTHRGVYMFGSTEPVRIDPARVREILGRSGVLDDLVNTGDAPVTSLDDWARVIDGLTWLSGDEVRRFASSAPLIVDDRPTTEYFLLRRLFGSTSPPMTEPNLRKASP